MFKRLIASLVCITFIFSNLQYVHAQDFSINQIPVPGSMINTTPAYLPLTLKGLIVHPENALKFDFLMDTGLSHLKGAALSDEALKIMKYFLTALTIPEDDLWVNLSPYEKDRIIQGNFGQTIMGRDLLAQDYILKQLTASLIYPEKALGKEFWQQVYSKASKEYGTTQIPVNTFNKVWIVPSEAVVWEHEGKVLIVKSHLKVMLEEDYLSLSKHQVSTNTHSLASNIVRTIVLPVLEKEANEGRNFAQLRQMYQAMILATWYKKALRESILNKVYANQKKTKGVEDINTGDVEAIYHQYLKAFKKGAFNYIKEDVDLTTGQPIPRKYFSGGFSDTLDATEVTLEGSKAQLSPVAQKEIDSAETSAGETFVVKGNLIEALPPSAAMVVVAKARIGFLRRTGNKDNNGNVDKIVPYLIDRNESVRQAAEEALKSSAEYIDQLERTFKDFPSISFDEKIMRLKEELAANHFSDWDVTRTLSELDKPGYEDAFYNAGFARLKVLLDIDSSGESKESVEKYFSKMKDMLAISSKLETRGYPFFFYEAGKNRVGELAEDHFRSLNIKKTLFELDKPGYAEPFYKAGSDRLDSLLRAGSNTDNLKSLIGYFVELDYRGRAAELKKPRPGQTALPVFYIDAILDRLADPKYPDNFKRLMLVIVKAKLPVQGSAGVKVMQKLADMVGFYGRNGEVSIPEWLKEALGPYKNIETVQALRNYILQKKAMGIIQKKEAKDIIHTLTLTGEAALDELQGDDYQESEYDGYLPLAIPLLVHLSSYEFQEGDFEKGQAEQLIKDIEKSVKKKGLLGSRKSDAIVRLNAFINNPDAWIILGVNHPLNPEETRARLEIVYPETPTRQRLVEVKYPTIGIAVNEGINDSIEPFKMFIKYAKMNRAPIETSRLAIKAIEGTILDRFFQHSVWEYVSPTEVRLRADISKEDEEQISSILSKVDLKDKRKLEGILEDARKVDLEKMPPRVLNLIIGLLRVKLGKAADKYGDDKLMAFFINYSDDKLRALNGISYKIEERTVTLGSGNKLIIPGKVFSGKKIKRAILENFFPQETPTIEGFGDILKERIVSLTDQKKKLAILDEALKESSPGISEWGMAEIYKMNPEHQKTIFDRIRENGSNYPNSKVHSWAVRRGRPDYSPPDRSAGVANPAMAIPLGGISLNAKLLDLQIKRDGNGIPLPLSQQPLDKINIQGFVPQIISIQPVNLSALFKE